jgi:ketosteroid isomerase-like protein
MLKFVAMKLFYTALIIALVAGFAVGQQDTAKQIFDTEKAFEKLVSEKGIKAGFIEFMAPSGVMFAPGAVNARQHWSSRPESPAALLWNPIWIEVSSNGLLAYSIGNSIYRPKGKDDTTEYHGHYISVWSRQPNGEYRAALDTGINHEKPGVIPKEWKSPAVAKPELNEEKLSAADSSTGFWQAVEKNGSVNAYRTFLAQDAVLLRDGRQPLFGKKDAVSYIGNQGTRIVFPKRKSFIETADLAYVYNTYSLVDKSGKETEHGNFVQVWKLRGGKWLIAAEALVPMPRT